MFSRRMPLPNGSPSGASAARYLALALPVILLAGCASRPSSEPAPVSQAWHRVRNRTAAPAVTSTQPASVTADPIAVVDGQPIERARLIELLLAGRGLDVLQELIVLELARSEVEAAGLTVTAANVQAEHDFELRRLLNPLPSAGSTDFDRQAGQRLLDQLLASRGISPAEYHLGRVRNAHLRKLAEARLTLTEADLDREYARSYGPRVRVRHIQLASPAEAERVRGLLEAGADFAELARRYSANAVTAGAGGLLEPLSAEDVDVPPLLRKAAFDLDVGQVSNPLRVGNWVHLIRVDERLPQSDPPRERVRDQLETQLRQRRLPDEMQRISAELFERARIRILDSKLEAEFQKRHPDRGRQPP